MSTDLPALKPPPRRLPLVLAIAASVAAHALVLAIAAPSGQTLRLPAERQVLNLSLETAAASRPDSAPGKQRPAPTPNKPTESARSTQADTQSTPHSKPVRKQEAKQQHFAAKKAPKPQPVERPANQPQAPRKIEHEAAAEAAPPAATGAPAAEPTPLRPPAYRGPTLHNPQPEYPFLARRRGLEGTVLLRVKVSTEGAPLKVFIVHSSGADILDQAALSAVSQWRFIPAHRGEERLEATVDVPVRFELRNG